jgi:drug/metabolite transporter (DMT)-like permease
MRNFRHARAPRHTQSVGVGLLILLAVLWGIPYALTKIALETISPVTLVAVRVSIAAIALWLAVWVSGMKVPMQPGFIGRTFIQGCIGCLVPYTLTTLGQQVVDSGLTSVLNSTSPVFVCLITLFFTKHEPITLSRAFGVAIGLAGIVVIAGVGSLGGLGRELLGQSVIVLATFSLALAAIHGRQFASVPPEVTAAAMLTWSALVLAPLCFILESPLNCMPSARSVAALLTNATLATALGFVIYFRLINMMGSVAAASIGYVKPAVGVIIGCAALGEPLTWQLTAGLIAVVVGVAAILCRLDISVSPYRTAPARP